MGSSWAVRFLVVCLLLMGPLAPVRAVPAPPTEPTLRAEVGWGGRTRSGKWAPVFVAVSSPRARNAIVELFAPHDATQASRIDLPVAVGPIEQTYVLYAPLLNSGEPVRISLLDASTGKLLKDRTLIDSFGYSDDSDHQNPFIVTSGAFVGVSGRGPALGALEQGNETPAVSFLEPSRLPRTARGYDALDLLALNQPDLAVMPYEQQAAIKDWVEAGGRLLIWPGENPLPPTGPIASLLPGKVGDVQVVTLTKEQLEAAGLPTRFGTFTGRTVSPEPGATVKYPFTQSVAPGAVAVTGYRGLGQVTLVSFNLSALLFDDQEKQKRFFSGFLDLSTRDGTNSRNAWESRPANQSQAAGQLMDLMGDVPGVGTFGFGYVAMVMLGMMAIVGPIDWFVLKWMRRQPWTWATTAGWIGLITAVALSLGTLLRSGELHFRTVSIIDQVDDRVVARLDAIGLYSPRTTDYRFEVRPGTWWEPMSADQFNVSRDVMRAIPFRQGANENVPQEDTVRVWNLRFLTGEVEGKGDPALAIDLWLTPGKQTSAATRPSAWSRKPPREPGRVHGTIRNVSTTTLPNLWLRTKLGVFDLAKQPGFPNGGLPAGASLTVDFPLNTRTIGFEPWAATANQTQPPGNGRYPIAVSDTTSALNNALAITKAIGNLPAERSREIDQRLTSSDRGAWAVVYAESEPSEGDVKLVDEQPKTKHWQVTRTLVPLKEGEPATTAP